MEKSQPITTQPINSPPPYSAKEDKTEKVVNFQGEQEIVHGDNVLQQPPQGQALPQAALPQATLQQATAVTVVQQPTNQTTLCECDGSWWGFCCLSLWFLGIGSLVADCKIHGSATGIGWGLLIMGIGRLLSIALSICSFLYQLGVIHISAGLYWAGVIIPTAVFILTIVLLHMQRRKFINHQLLSGSYPNNEDCCCMCCTVFWCSPCNHGQIASAVYKQTSQIVPVQVV